MGMHPAVSFPLPPQLQAALPPGEPGAKPPPKAAALPTLRQRWLERGSVFSVYALLPEPLRLDSVALPSWLAHIWDTADTRMLGLMLARWRSRGMYSSDEPTESLLHGLVLQHGLGTAFDALLHAARWQAAPHAEHTLQQDVPFTESPWDLAADPTATQWQFRSHWMRAEAGERVACMAQLHAAWPLLPPKDRTRLAILLPEAADLAEALLANASAEQREHSSAWLRWAAHCTLDAICGDGQPVLNDRQLQAVLLRAHGPALLPTLLALVAPGQVPGRDGRYPDWALAAIDHPDATAALARLAARNTPSAKALAWVCAERPRSACLPLAQVLEEGGLPPGAVARLAPLLKSVAVALGDALPALLPAMGATARKLLAPQTGRTTAAEVLAPRQSWPAVLAEPPWTRAMAPTPPAMPGLPTLAPAPQDAWEAHTRAAWLQRDALWSGRYSRAHVAGLFSQKLPAWPGAAIAALGSDAAEVARFVADWETLRQDDASGRGWSDVDHLTVEKGWDLHPAVAVALWNAVGWPTQDCHVVSYVARFGVDALPGLLNVVRADRDGHFIARFIGAAELAPHMAYAHARRPAYRALARAWLLRFPRHAAAGLLPAALGEPGEPQAHARAALRQMAALGQVDPILGAARAHGDAQVLAATEALLAQDPLQDFPTRIHTRSKLPAFWQPAGWRRPRLQHGDAPGAALPDEALHPLGLMLSFAADGTEAYAGLEQVKAACAAQSLADFAWDACASWEAAGASPANNWALRALGVVGTDETTRQLGALVRRWSAPGASTSTRMAWALEALARIGSDAALLQLDAIGRRHRMAAVQAQARELLQGAADARGLSAEELQDRVVPDLGLDTRGTLLLDFGPRQFQVGFDELLVPHVRALGNGKDGRDGRAGARLASAPRPRADDDATQAAAAVQRFKALKQDAALVASQQPLRLERAMCTGRSWTPEDFRRFLADHPLMRHLVQRVLCGIVVADADASAVPLLAAFRVNAEGEWVDADDTPWVAPSLPPGTNWRVTIAHPLLLDAAQVTAFAQQLADYELLQPFEQLQRGVHRPTDAERAQHTLARWAGLGAFAGPLWGLEARGWQRVYGDGGNFHQVQRRSANGIVLTLPFTPGLARGGDDTRQTLGELRCSAPLAELPPVDFSEAVRDLDAIALRRPT